MLENSSIFQCAIVRISFEESYRSKRIIINKKLSKHGFLIEHLAEKLLSKEELEEIDKFDPVEVLRKIVREEVEDGKEKVWRIVNTPLHLYFQVPESSLSAAGSTSITFSIT